MGKYGFYIMFKYLSAMLMAVDTMLMSGEVFAPEAIVREARRHAGVTQAALAGRLGTAQSVVSRWERGVDEPRLSTLRAIASACGLRLCIGLEEDVDRGQIRQHLEMTPEARLRAVANVSRFKAVARPSETPRN